MPSVLRSTATAILTPEDVGALLIEPLLSASVAATVCTTVQTTAATFRIPKVTDDGGADWVAEADPIPETAPTFAEVVVRPEKVAKLVPVSLEAAEDTTPEAAQVIGQRIAEALAEAVDEAFCGSLSAPAPAGLGSISPTTINAGSSWSNLDVFAAGASAAEQTGATLSSWLISPDDALALAQLKSATGSLLPLLAAQPGQAARRVVEGLPLIVSRFVPRGVIYGIPQARTFLVVRSDAEVVTDSSFYFNRAQLAVRGIARVGFGFPSPQSIVKLALSGAED